MPYKIRQISQRRADCSIFSQILAQINMPQKDDSNRKRGNASYGRLRSV